MALVLAERTTFWNMCVLVIDVDLYVLLILCDKCNGLLVRIVFVVL